MWRRAAVATVIALTASFGLVSSAAAATYYVQGTGRDGLYERSGPSQGYAVVGLLREGSPVDIACQVYGQDINGSSVWDRLSNGAYVSDYYVSTPNFGSFSVGACDGGGGGGTDSGGGDSTPPPDPTPQPGPAHFVITDGPHFGGTFELGSAYVIKFRVANDGGSTGTTSFGMTESGTTANQDHLAGTQTKSVTLAPGASQQVTFLFSHKWNWIRPDKHGAVAKIASVAKDTHSVSDILYRVRALRLGIEKFIVRRGYHAVQVFRVSQRVDKVSTALGYAELAASAYDFQHTYGQPEDLEHDFTYRPSASNSAGLQFDGTTVPVTVPLYKQEIYCDSLTAAAKSLAAQVLGLYANPITMVASFAASKILDHSAAVAYEAAYDPVDDIHTVPGVPTIALAEVAALPDGPAKHLLQAEQQIAAVHDALAASTIRLAGAYEQDDADAEQLQLVAEQRFAQQEADLLDASSADRSAYEQSLVTQSPADLQQLVAAAQDAATHPTADQTQDDQALDITDLTPQLAAVLTELDFSTSIDAKGLLEGLDADSRAVIADSLTVAEVAQADISQNLAVPTPELALSGPTTDGLWYRGAVQATVASADPQDGESLQAAIDGGPFLDAASTLTVTGEGTHTVAARITEANGTVSAVVTRSVHIDGTGPTVTVTPRQLPNAAGWYNTDVDLDATCTDALSGVATCPATHHLDGEGSHQLLTFAGIDNAGNGSSVLADVSIDKTAPQTSLSAETPVSAPWYGAAGVTITLAAADPLSGVASTSYAVDGGPSRVYTGPLHITTDGIHHLAYSSEDVAGNVEATHVTDVYVDAAAPAVVASLSSQPNAAGWYRTPVTASFICSDGESGVQSCPRALSFGEGGNQTANVSASDLVGNVASLLVGPLNVDMTAPVITFSDDASTWDVDQTVSFRCAATDALSGLATNGCRSLSTPAYRLPLGTSTLTASATDVAGNAASATGHYTVTPSFDGTCRLVKALSTNTSVASGLCDKLNAARDARSRGDRAGGKNQLEAFRNQLRAQSGKALTADQVGVLDRVAVYLEA